MAMTAVFTTIGGQMYHENRGGTESLYIPDPLGSLIACKDTSGTTTYTADYWPYGEVRTESGTNPSKWGFVGLLGYLVDFASLLYVRARFYKPNLGRWATVDPLWPIQQLYTYGAGKPTFTTDPSGMIPCPYGGQKIFEITVPYVAPWPITSYISLVVCKRDLFDLGFCGFPGVIVPCFDTLVRFDLHTVHAQALMLAGLIGLGVLCLSLTGMPLLGIACVFVGGITWVTLLKCMNPSTGAMCFDLKRPCGFGPPTISCC